MLVVVFLVGCGEKSKPSSNPGMDIKDDAAFQLVILGTVQDAGSPHVGCEKECCSNLSLEEKGRRRVSCIGLFDRVEQKTFLFDATPDIVAQINGMNAQLSLSNKQLPDGIFLTHAHIGHYTGLMFLGRESVNASKVPVYAMPRMFEFLKSNGPWSQLVDLQNIELKLLRSDSLIKITKGLSVTPIVVPHRDEFSETVGYIIAALNKKVLFIPDIDKWMKWNRDITDYVKLVDYAFIDATFYGPNEVKRSMNEIPHPFVVESMAMFESLPDTEKAKIHFIHLNHTNPLLNSNSEEYKEVISKGFHVARIEQVFDLE